MQPGENNPCGEVMAEACIVDEEHSDDNDRRIHRGQEVTRLQKRFGLALMHFVVGGESEIEGRGVGVQAFGGRFFSAPSTSAIVPVIRFETGAFCLQRNMRQHSGPWRSFT